MEYSGYLFGWVEFFLCEEILSFEVFSVEANIYVLLECEMMRETVWSVTFLVREKEFDRVVKIGV